MRGDLLTSCNGKTITYDTIGNPTNDGEWNYAWEKGRQLSRMSKSGTSWTFTYDANGLRTGRSGGGKTYQYVYSGSQLRKMTVDGHTLIFDYDANGHPLTVTYDGYVFFYITNLQGDVIAIVDDSGELAAGYTYNAWGQYYETGGNYQTTLGRLNPLRYRGYVYDQETGLYYLQSRYYNPEWGRFINADDPAYLGADGTLQGYNLYAYCGNNPVMHSDPTGRFVITTSSIIIAAAIGFVVGATAGGLAGAAVAACNDTDIMTGFVSGFIGGGIMGAGAGVGSLFLAPLAIGSSVALGFAGGVTTLTTGGAVATGLAIGGITGMVGGGLTDLTNQLGNNGGTWSNVDYGSVAISAVEYGTLNTLGTYLGSLMGPHTTTAINLLGSTLLNVVPGGWGAAIDIIRGQV